MTAPTPATPLQKLCAYQKTMVDQHVALLAAAADARTAMKTPAPEPFDEDAAVKRVAAALAADAINGTSKAPLLKAEVRAEREAIAAAIGAHQAAMVEARKTADRCEADAAALYLQIVEMDKMIRAEVADTAKALHEVNDPEIYDLIDKLTEATTRRAALSGLLNTKASNIFGAELPDIHAEGLRVFIGGSVKPGYASGNHPGTFELDRSKQRGMAEHTRRKILAEMTGGTWPFVNIWSKP
jgi:hypothetical protein